MSENETKPIVYGPTYQEMSDPSSMPKALFQRAQAARSRELDPVNLFNIHWFDNDLRVRYRVLTPKLTGVRANILVLVGKDFPSGSHKVGPAYSTLMEGELKGEIRPGQKTVLGPSTGNFGIGTAYVSTLKGYKSIVIMPDSMSQERYDRIKKYGGTLDLTPGTESDVILTLERTYELKRDPKNYTLAQFELLPNYRFHRLVTGRAALAAARDFSDGRVACFVSAPGSAGTIAAGDEIKAAYPDCMVAAVEPRECATLYDNSRGQHRIEGIGDKMVTLIHNLLTTDYVVLVHDDDCVKGAYLLSDGVDRLAEAMEMDPKSLADLRHVFGISGLCNVLGAIKMARYLDLNARDTVVTVATDGFDRYPSVIAELRKRMGRLGDGEIRPKTSESWARSVFHGQDADEVMDVRGKAQKDRLYRQKEEVWSKFGYTRDYLDSMKSMAFWDGEYARIPEVDEALRKARGDGR